VKLVFKEGDSHQPLLLFSTKWNAARDPKPV
jgi:hypothetical protein